MDEQNSVVDAFLVENGRIVAVSSGEDLLSETGTKAGLVDLDGKMLLPGFIEVHGHFPGSGLTEVSNNQKNVLLQVIGLCSPVAE